MSGARNARQPLHGAAVLVTRPRGEAAPWRRRIEALGGIAICQPGIEVGPAADDEPTLENLRRILPEDWLVFTSPAAVRYALSVLGEGPLPASTALWAVGRRTAQDLERAVQTPVRAPADGAGSEALLAEPPFAQVHGRRILILGARGGRTQLYETLTRRGAQVHPVYVYQRWAPKLRRAALKQLRDHFPQVISIATSVEILTHISALVEDRLPAPLTRRPLSVISPRIATAAEKLGYRQVAVSADSGLDSVLESVAGVWGRGQKLVTLRDSFQPKGDQ